MTADDALVAVLTALDDSAIPYMIVGSLASNFYGVPRSTRDADFVIELTPGALDRLSHSLQSPLSLAPQGAFEAVTGTTRFLIVLEHSPFVAELFVRSDDAHDRERFQRRQRVTLMERTVFIATAEDMVITKLRWAADAARLKDREDIRNMLAVSGSALDWDYLRQWTSLHGTVELLAEIRASIPSS